MPEVDRVIGNSDKLLRRSLGVADALVIRDMARVTEIAPHLAVALRPCARVRRGAERLRPSLHLLRDPVRPRAEPVGAGRRGGRARSRALVEAGKREVVLTGVDLTSYGADLPGAPTLGQLVERILRARTRLQRLRLSSLDALEIDDRLFALLTQEPRVMPHLHLSLQAGDDMILKRMKRRHPRADAVRAGRAAQGRAARHRDRRGPDRRLPDRGRGDGRQHAWR